MSNSSPKKEDKGMVKVFRKLRSAGGMGRRRSRPLKAVSSTTSLPEHRSAAVDLEWDLESMESSVAPQGYSATSEISPRSMSTEESTVDRDEKSAGDSTTDLPLVVYNNKSSPPQPTLPDALQTWGTYIFTTLRVFRYE